MTPEQIKNLVKQEIQQANAAKRFQLSSIPRHVHNGADSPVIFSPTQTYVGLVGYDGTVLLLPKGWTLEKDAGLDGTYYVTHNLNTLLYTCVASGAQSTNIYPAVVVSAFEKEVDFVWADIATAAKADTSFFFTLTVVSNKSAQIPTYYGTYTSS